MWLVPRRASQVIAPQECSPFYTAIEKYEKRVGQLPRHLKNRIIVDVNSFVTECNANMSLIMLEALGVASRHVADEGDTYHGTPRTPAHAHLEPAPGGGPACSPEASCGSGERVGEADGRPPTHPVAKVAPVAVAAVSGETHASVGVTGSSGASGAGAGAGAGAQAPESALAVDTSPDTAPVVLRIVTSDWHMARSLMAFWDVAEAVCPDSAEHYTILPCPASTDPEDLPKYLIGHLLDGRVQATRVARWGPAVRVARTHVPRSPRVYAGVLAVQVSTLVAPCSPHVWRRVGGGGVQHARGAVRGRCGDSRQAPATPTGQRRRCSPGTAAADHQAW